MTKFIPYCHICNEIPDIIYMDDGIEYCSKCGQQLNEDDGDTEYGEEDDYGDLD